MVQCCKEGLRSPSKDKDFVKTTPKDLDLVGDIPPLEVPVRRPSHLF